MDVPFYSLVSLLIWGILGIDVPESQFLVKDHFGKLSMEALVCTDGLSHR